MTIMRIWHDMKLGGAIASVFQVNYKTHNHYKKKERDQSQRDYNYYGIAVQVVVIVGKLVVRTCLFGAGRWCVIRMMYNTFSCYQTRRSSRHTAFCVRNYHCGRARIIRTTAWSSCNRLSRNCHSSETRITSSCSWRCYCDCCKARIAISTSSRSSRRLGWWCDCYCRKARVVKPTARSCQCRKCCNSYSSKARISLSTTWLELK